LIFALFIPPKGAAMLTDAKVRKIKPLEKRAKYADEKGMYLEVLPTGGMYWRLKFRINGKESVFSIGIYPDISLANARIERDKAKLLIQQGINPNEAKKRQQQEIDQDNLFKTLALEWMENRKDMIKEELINVTSPFLKKIFFLS
jgi:uncharacterized FlgJ-related protein